MIRRMAEQNKELMTRLERQQGEMKRTNEAIEQLNKAVREMKQQLKEADK
jgi:methyl-accepting chemotaxis protein